ncbi:MAG: YgcG family protein [Betaproteobacteria bacterium]
MRTVLASASAFLATLVASAALAQAPAWEGGSDGLKPIPALSAHVTDLAATLSDAERQALESKLVAFESATGAQLAVLIVPTTQPEPIEAYAIRVADAWKIGRKGRDDGALLLVAKNDRRLRLEVGYGLEGLIPDALARRIVSDDVAPKFRDGNYAAGIGAGVDRIIGIVQKGELPPPEKRASTQRGVGGFDWGTIAILALVVVPMVGGVLKSMFGKIGGSTVGAALAGGVTWFVIGSIALALGAAVVAWLVILLLGGVGSALGGGRRGGGVFVPGGWGGGGGGLGGGGWSGGGGGFGGGGASGSW